MEYILLNVLLGVLLAVTFIYFCGLLVSRVLARDWKVVLSV